MSVYYKKGVARMNQTHSGPVGLDVGTCNLVVARKVSDKIITSRLRNAFVDIDEEQRGRLANSDLSVVDIKDSSYVVGDEAVNIARILNKTVRRPMASGVLNPKEKEGRQIISALVSSLVGRGNGEKCYFSVPAVPLDTEKANTVWHTGFFSSLLEKLGWEPHPVNEALSIIYNECADDDYSGIAISHGAGQVNVCVSYKLVGTIEFSVARSGDWIDEQSSHAVGTPIAKVLKVKENPAFDLQDHSELDQEIGPALYYHYQAMLNYVIGHLVTAWNNNKDRLELPDAVPIILSGGTASIKGFKDLWIQQLNKKGKSLPFQVKEVKLASDPMSCVAKGLLVNALSQE